MVLGLAHRRRPFEPEPLEVAAQVDERLAVQVADEMERAVEEDLRLADAAEQRVVLAADRRRGQSLRGRDDVAPRPLEERARHRRLGHRGAQPLVQRLVGRADEEMGEHAVHLGTGDFLVIVERRECNGLHALQKYFRKYGLTIDAAPIVSRIIDSLDRFRVFQ